MVWISVEVRQLDDPIKVLQGSVDTAQNPLVTAKGKQDMMDKNLVREIDICHALQELACIFNRTSMQHLLS